MRPLGPKNALTSWIQRRRAGHQSDVLRRRRRALRRPEVVGEPKEHVAAPLHRARRAPLDLTVACILDEFSWDNLSPEAHFYRVSRDGWREALAANPPAFLLVESAWRGNDDAWVGCIEDLAPDDDGPLGQFVRTCRAMGIPTVFWNKEDPPHYRRFIGAARLFDYIFTSDANCLPHYARDAPNSRLGVLPFAAQPLLQNPVNRALFGRKGDVCFAGAWYPQHRERHADTRNLLRAASAFDLAIYDRFLNYQHGYRNRFPEEFQSMIRGSLSFDEMQSAYRQFPVFLNVNSVKDSPTMFSRRVLELLACGTAVVSGYARGIEELLGRDIVPMCRSAEEARQVIVHLLTDERHRDELILRAQRRIFSEHTYLRRMRTICEAMGATVTDRGDTVTAVMLCAKQDDVRRALDSVVGQRVAIAEILLVCGEGNCDTQFAAAMAELAFPGPVVKVSVAVERWRDDLLDVIAANVSTEFVVFLDSRDHYGRNHVADALHALEYSGASCVGKSRFYRLDADSLRIRIEDTGLVHQFVSEVPLATALARVRFLASSRAQFLEIGDARFKIVGTRDDAIYSATQYNYVWCGGAVHAAKAQDRAGEDATGLAVLAEVCI